MGRNASVGISTCYGRSGNRLPVKAIFSASVQTVTGRGTRPLPLAPWHAFETGLVAVPSSASMPANRARNSGFPNTRRLM